MYWYDATIASMPLAQTIFWLVISWGCGALFASVGWYAHQKEKPMWFWTGSTVLDKEISDIPAYNKANGRMWMVYSLPYWLSGALYTWFPMVATIIIVVSSTLGLAWLIWCYRRIYRKYRADNNQ